MQHSQKATSETKSQSFTYLGLERKAGIVQAKLGKRFPKFFEIVVIGRVKAAEHHRLWFFVAWQGGGSWAVCLGDGVANVHILELFHLGIEETHLARAECVARGRGRPELSNFGNFVFGVSPH